MVAPVIVVAGAMAGSAILNYVLNKGVAESQIKTSNYIADYSRRYNKENNRYWADYYKNTGKAPRYPMRAGAEYNLASMYSANTSAMSARASVYRSMMNVGTSGAFALGSFYSRPAYNYRTPYASPNYMYR